LSSINQSPDISHGAALHDSHDTVIGKIFEDKNFRDDNIGGAKMSFYCP
jgi:hypothetical protein